MHQVILDGPGRRPRIRELMVQVVHPLDPVRNIKPDQQRSREKIDGIVAPVMAIGMAMVREEPPRCVYDGIRGIMLL